MGSGERWWVVGEQERGGGEGGRGRELDELNLGTLVQVEEWTICHYV